MVGRLDQKQTIRSVISSNLTHRVEPIEVGDCLRLRQLDFGRAWSVRAPIGSLIRHANNTLGIRLSKRRLERKHYESAGAPQARPNLPLILAIRTGSRQLPMRNAVTRRLTTSGLAIELRRAGRYTKSRQPYWLNYTTPNANRGRGGYGSTSNAGPGGEGGDAARPDDHRLGLHNPVVEGARCAFAERHRLARFRTLSERRRRSRTETRARNCGD